MAYSSRTPNDEQEASPAPGGAVGTKQAAAAGPRLCHAGYHPALPEEKRIIQVPKAAQVSSAAGFTGRSAAPGVWRRFNMACCTVLRPARRRSSVARKLSSRLAAPRSRCAGLSHAAHEDRQMFSQKHASLLMIMCHRSGSDAGRKASRRSRKAGPSNGGSDECCRSIVTGTRIDALAFRVWRV